MEAHNLVALVTIAALLLFAATFIRVGAARVKHGVKAPAVAGHEIFERHFRVQMNTLEQLVVFLPALWLYALYWSDLVAAAVGVVWLAGRVIYMVSYVKDPAKRGLGFLIGMVANLVLVVGAAVGAGMAILQAGGI